MRPPAAGDLAPFLLLPLLLVAACAPRVLPAGAPMTTPRVAADALVMPDGARLPLRRSLPDGTPRAVVLALHGFNDRNAAFAPAEEPFAEAGIALYSYDQRGFGLAPGHGHWPGRWALVDDLATAARLVRAEHPDAPLFLMGESMGAAVIMAGLGNGRVPPPAGSILLAPAVWGWSSLPWTHAWALTAAAHTLPWLRLTGEGLDIRPTDNPAVMEALVRDPLVIKRTRVEALYGLTNLMEAAHAAAPALDGRLLVLYGEQDELIPAYAMRQVVARLPGAAADRQTLALYAEGWHLLLRDLQGERVIRDIIAWIEAPGAPLPSGADSRAAARVAGRDQ